MIAEQVAQIRSVCLALQGGDIVARYNDAEIAAICNGVGAVWMDRVAPHASAILNRCLPWAVAPAIIHDLRYHEGAGGSRGRAHAHSAFLAGCRIMIDACSLWRLPRWWRRRKADALYLILRRYGALAWEGNND